MKMGLASPSETCKGVLQQFQQRRQHKHQRPALATNPVRAQCRSAVTYERDAGPRHASAFWETKTKGSFVGIMAAHHLTYDPHYALHPCGHVVVASLFPVSYTKRVRKPRQNGRDTLLSAS